MPGAFKCNLAGTEGPASESGSNIRSGKPSAFAMMGGVGVVPLQWAS